MADDVAADTQTRLALHGSVVLLLGLLGGIGFSYAATVGDTASEIYRIWKFVHLEGVINGIMVLAVAGVWLQLGVVTKAVSLGRHLLVLGAYCNAVGPWITALFVGHRVIEPHTVLERIVVYGFYIPGTLPIVSFAIFVWAFYKATRLK